MDMDKYLRKYHNVSREDLEKIRANIDSPVLFEELFDFRVRHLDEKRENEKINGKREFLAGPLLQVLSVSLRPLFTESVAVYGRIYGEYYDIASHKNIIHDLYKRDCDDAEVVGSSGRLTLISPPFMHNPNETFLPLYKTKITVDLFDRSKKVLVQDCFSLEDGDEDYYEQVNSKCIHGDSASLVMHYVAIPFGVYGRVAISFYHKQSSNEGKEICSFVNLNGKVATRYSNTYGNYASEECVLFEKGSHEFEQLHFGGTIMRLSRYWVALPAYSTLVVDVNLLDFKTGNQIIRESVKFKAQSFLMSDEWFTVGDIRIEVRVAWSYPTQEGPHKIVQQMDESSEDEISSCQPDPSKTSKEEADIMQEDDESSNLNLPWALRRHKPWSSPSVEVFSVFVGREKCKALQIYGSIELLYGDHSFVIFKRDENSALRISKYDKAIPIQEGSRLYEEFNPLEMKVDLKNVDNCFSIKGYGEWPARALESELWHDKCLCSFFQGEHGFVAVHYTILSHSVQANIEVSCKPKMGYVNVHSTVYGSVVAYYSSFDYSSRYNKDHYGSVLFKRIRDDSVQVTADGILPLSRSTVVVPSYSSLMIDVDLSVGNSNQRLLCTEEFEIGTNLKRMEADDCFVDIKVEWSEVK